MSNLLCVTTIQNELQSYVVIKYDNIHHKKYMKLFNNNVHTLFFDFFWLLLELLDELSFLLDLPNTLDEATFSGAVTY